MASSSDGSRKAPARSPSCGRRSRSRTASVPSLVAEGVEDVETLQALRLYGCDITQGYVHCPPLPADELDRWLQARHGGAATTAVGQPGTHPAQGLADVGGRAGEGHSDVRTAVYGVEVDAGCDRNARVRQQLCAEVERVGRVVGDVGVDVERAVGRRQPVSPIAGSPRSSRSRLTAYCSTSASASVIDSGSNAAMAASCGRVGGQIEKLPVRRSTAR